MTVRFVAIATAAGLAVTIAAASALAGTGDYTFEPVSKEVRNGPGSEITVRLIHKPTGKPVEGAVIFRSRLDMSPDGMAAMTAKHEPMTATEPGVYRFRADLTMAGGWALKLMAKVQGEVETVQGAVIFQAGD